MFKYFIFKYILYSNNSTINISNSSKSSDAQKALKRT